MSNGEGKRLGMPIEIAKQNLRDDPNTHAIAKALGVEVEDYIEKVLDYALHPEKEPELEILDDESIAQLGPDAPTMADVNEWFEKVAAGEISLDDRIEVAASDEYSTDDAKRAALARAGAEPSTLRAPGPARTQWPASPPAPEAPSGAGSVLRQQLLEQQRQLRMGMDARRAGKGAQPSPKKPDEG